jgi:quercetin dioxygenase-like cupin family protein
MLFPKQVVKYDEIEIHIYHTDKRQMLPKHTHSYPHLTMCHAGSCIVRKENKEIILTKNSNPINLVANEWHEIEALEDNTVFVNIFKQVNG